MLSGKILHLFSFGDNFFLFAKEILTEHQFFKSKKENENLLLCYFNNTMKTDK